MLKYDQILSEQYPVRKTAEEKQAFLDYLKTELNELGYSPELESNGFRKSQNLVVGNPEKAAIVLCAHYDTPATKWIGHTLVPLNVPVYLGCQLLNMLLMLILALILYVIAWQALGKTAVWVFLFSYLFLLLWQVAGKANRHNRNQSSGLAVMMEVMARLPDSARDSIAFIFFDRGESFTSGAKAYAKEHLQVQYTRLVLQLDVLGKGKELLLIPKKTARKCTGFQRLVRILDKTEGMKLHVEGNGLSVCPGDYKSFQCGMILLACTQSPVIGLHVSNLHSEKDTDVDDSQLESVTESLIQALGALNGTAQNHVDEKQ